MRSALHKVLHPVGGKPLIQRALDLAVGVGADDPVVVLGHLPEQVRAVLPPSTRTVVQEPQRGTGHAVQVAADLLRQDGADRLLVLYGDTALVEPSTLRQLVNQPVAPDVPIALLTARLPNPYGYGRVLRAADGTVAGMVEESEATDEQRQVNEIWSGLLVAWAPWVWEQLWQLEPRAKGEYYLPDLVNLARGAGLKVLAVEAPSADEVHGVNDRAQLAQANAILWRRTAERLMQAGVTILDPARTYIDSDVEVGEDTVIYPGCFLRGRTRIATGCVIGPDTDLFNARVGEGTRVVRSTVEDSTLGNHVRVGPYAHVRGGATIEDDVELGNYAEVKGSRIGRGTKQHHFSYVGDADIGERVNLSAGIITMNYDGRVKHRTVVGDDAFIGSDTLLRAPIRVGKAARTGAGAVVIHDVPDGEVWAGVPARRLSPKDAP